jgi:hypothetical protein
MTNYTLYKMHWLTLRIVHYVLQICDLVRVSVLKEKSVGAELGLGDVVDALVVEVALLRVGEKTVRFGTFEIWERA